MKLHRVLMPAVVIAALALTGCASDSAAERAQAYEECQEKITPQFDDPATVSWPEEGWGYSGSGDSRQIVAVVEEGEERTEVSCMLTRADAGWELSSYDFSEPQDEVIE